MISISSSVKTPKIAIRIFFLFTKCHERKRQSACLSVSKGSCIVYVWKYLNLTWWTIRNNYFRWVNNGRKNSNQKETSLTRAHACFLINLSVSKLLIKNPWSKESAVLWSLNKNKLMWYFFHNKPQFFEW